MSLIPAFEIGVWNAWIFMVAFVFFHMIQMPFMALFNRKAFDAMSQKAPQNPPYNPGERKVAALSYILLILLFLYSIVLPLPLGSAWLYTGLAIFAVGVIVFQLAGVSWWYSTSIDDPTIKGIYRYSRHPMYFGMLLELLGISIAAASWLFLLLTIVLTVLMNSLVTAEERFCCEKFGDTYLNYMNQTPRWLGVPKS